MIETKTDDARNTPVRKFLNIKVGTDFFNTLMSSPIYKQNWKAVSAAQEFLRQVARHQNNNEGERITYYNKKIKDLFKPYTGGKYAPYISALEELGLLERDMFYWHSPLGKTEDNECRKYRVTDKGLDLLFSGEREYLKQLLTDPVVRRANQNRISKRKVIHKHYDDPVCQYIHDTNCGLTFDTAGVEKMLDDPYLPIATKEHIIHSLLNIAEKKFVEPIRQDIDGRIPNDIALMRSNVRRFLYYNGRPYRGVFDIRAAHPTFFSSLIITENICAQFLKQPPSPPNLLTQPNHPTQPKLPHPLHYEGDKLFTQGTEGYRKGLIIEHRRWVALFTDATIDPRQVIAQSIGEGDIKSVKAGLNETINGSKKHPLILRWLQSEYPLLFTEWQKTDIAHTGCRIAKAFESPLTTDPQLYIYAKDMDIRLSYEYDGCGFLSEEDKDTLRQQVQFLTDYLSFMSNERWGVPIVIKTQIYE